MLGYQLKPFSAYHATCLLMLDSPFVHGGSPSYGDIMTALMVCSGNRRTGMSRAIDFQNSRLRQVWWSIRLFFSSIGKVIAAIDNHINAYKDFPQIATPIGPRAQSDIVAKKTGAPWAYFIVSVMWQRTGADLDKIWDMPLCELACHKAIKDELEGLHEIADGLLEERERNSRRREANG